MIKTQRRLAILVLIFLVLLTSCAGRDPAPPQDYYICDEAQVIRDDTHAYMLEKSRYLSRATGAQIVVMTVQTTGEEDIDEYAARIFNAWDIGDEEKENGVLLLLSIEDAEYRIFRGQGLEDILSDGILTLMLHEHLEPHFIAGDYDSGVRKTYDALLDHLESAYSITIAEGTVPMPDPPFSATEETAPRFKVIRLLYRIFVRVFRFVILSFSAIPFIVKGVIAVAAILLIRLCKTKSKEKTQRNRNPYSSGAGEHKQHTEESQPPPPSGGGDRHR